MQDGDEEDPAVANLPVQHGQFIDWGRSDATINSRSGSHISRPRTLLQELMVFRHRRMSAGGSG
eukprot:4361384-Alexandrium_andersonii.AAC.1